MRTTKKIAGRVSMSYRLLFLALWFSLSDAFNAPGDGTSRLSYGAGALQGIVHAGGLANPANIPAGIIQGIGVQHIRQNVGRLTPERQAALQAAQDGGNSIFTAALWILGISCLVFLMAAAALYGTKGRQNKPVTLEALKRGEAPPSQRQRHWLDEVTEE